ncbi:PDR/VanB family oxidoreductase [Rhizobium lusitanum]|uniref:PDR/VanB family oxidoreductase n=1 Tax=Rhizobium lusitanum TaxID=293958 RepID=UPI001574E74E|nr:PDR/VanB family oxidoreductase [Rhizobium lusitanum]NTJ11807.1 oxidoreductase [Rhizobium lusitanum]
MDETRLAARVANRKFEAEGIVSLELVSVDNRPLPAFSAGAHVDLYMGNGIMRQYSICNDPSERHRYLLGILKEPSSRGGSLFVHENLQVGTDVSVGLPRCNFPLEEAASKSVLIAGGIGITPMLAMAYRLARLGKSFHIHYCARSLDRVAFRDQLDDAPLAGSTHLHVDDGDPAQRFSFGDDIGLPEDDTHLYVCGPEGFINYIVEQSSLFGWSASQVHVEFFRAQAKSADGDHPISVTAARSGITVEVEAGRSIASVLLENGVDIAVACEQGICGTCVTSVLEGEPLHRDEYLSAVEKASNKLIMVCCSRAKTGSLVLDV